MKTILTGILIVLQGILFAGEITLIQDGRPNAEIVLGEKPTVSAQLAAFELNHHFRLITGIELPVSAKATPAPGIKIHLGTAYVPSRIEYSEVEVSADRIRIFGFDAPLYGKVDYQKPKTYGNGSRGTLFAAYDFLEQFCDVRWYAPGKTGTVFTPRKTLKVKTGKSRIVPPAFEYRRLSPMKRRGTPAKFYGCKDRDIQLLYMRWRTFHYTPGDMHNIYPIYYEYYAPAQRDPELRKIFKETRKEYFAQGYDGVMAPVDPYVRREYPGDADVPPGICFSHPGPVKYFADMAIRKWNNEKIVGLPRPYTPHLPNRPFFSTISHMDATSMCRCAKCRKRLAAGESIQWQFIADVANEVAKTNPEINITSGAYQDRSPYPENVKFPKNTGVSLPLGVHAWWNPDFYKIQHDEIFLKWLSHFPGERVAVWLYIFGPSWDSVTRYRHKYFPGLYPRHLGRIVQEIARAGVRGCILEVELEQNTIEAYLACRLFYNPEQDVDRLVDEYLEKYYQEAAPEMKAFYAEIENAYWNWKNYPKSMFGPKGAAEKQRLNSLGSGMLTAERNWAIGTPERIRKLDGLMKQAEQKASPLVKQRLALIRRAFWDQAVAGEQEHRRRMLNLAAPVKSIIIPRIPDAGGDPGKVDWTKAVPAGNCHLQTTGKEIPDAFTFRLAADRKFVYMELIDRRKITKAGKWLNYMEIYLSHTGGFPVIQLGFGIDWGKPLAWKTDLINDAVRVDGMPPAVLGMQYRLLSNRPYWHWRLAMPFKKMFGTDDVNDFKMNFRRINPEARLLWNRFFASSADCLEPGNMGQVRISELDRPEELPFAENRFRGEIGTWRMLDGVLKFTGKKGEASARFTGKNDALLALKSVPVRPGRNIRVRFRVNDPELLAVFLQPSNGVRKLPKAKAKRVSFSGGICTAEFDELKRGSRFTVILTAKRKAEAVLSGFVIEFQ